MFFDHDKNKPLCPDLQSILDRGWLHPGSIVVADNVRRAEVPCIYAPATRHVSGTPLSTRRTSNTRPWCPTWYWSPNTGLVGRLVVDWSLRGCGVAADGCQTESIRCGHVSLMYPSIDPMTPHRKSSSSTSATPVFISLKPAGFGLDSKPSLASVVDDGNASAPYLPSTTFAGLLQLERPERIKATRTPSIAKQRVRAAHRIHPSHVMPSSLMLLDVSRSPL